MMPRKLATMEQKIGEKQKSDLKSVYQTFAVVAQKTRFLFECINLILESRTPNIVLSCPFHPDWIAFLYQVVVLLC